MPLKIEYLSPDEIQVYDRNARIHSDEQIAQIVHSIREFGFTNPVLIDDKSELIAGHGRLAAAEDMGLDSVPAIRLTGLTEKQVKALRIADNQLALNASWDLDLLTAELSELDAEEFDLDLLGFDEDFLAGLLSVDDDGLPSGEAPEESDAADQDESIQIFIGPYKFSVKKHEWQKWETSVRAKVGMDADSVNAELKKRLGF
jgi:ParB family chromosome partitioning protein